MMRKTKQDEAVDDLVSDVKDLLDAYKFLEVLSAINDTDTLLVAAKILEEDQWALPEVAAQLAEALRELATSSFAKKHAAKRRAAGCPPQDDAKS